MFGSEILDVAIGLIFVYLLLSLISSAVQEGIEAWTKTRAVYLERGMRDLLNDADGTKLAREIYQHPVIYGLFNGTYDPALLRKANNGGVRQMPRGTNLPSYIPRENFAVAILDYVAHGPVDETQHAAGATSQTLSVADLRRRLTDDPTLTKLTAATPKLRRALLAAIDAADGDLHRTRAAVEGWYDSAMDRVSGAYKRQTQRILCVLGIALAIVLNVDSLRIADYLYTHTEVREAIVAEATVVAHDTTFKNRTQDVRARVSQLNTLHLPVGWDSMVISRSFVRDLPSFWRYVMNPVLGWLMTGLAVSLGAPFWFDLLNKVMVVRATVKPKEKSPDETSRDNRPAPKPVPNDQPKDGDA